MDLVLIGGSSEIQGGLERYCARLQQAFTKYSTAYSVTWIKTNTAKTKNINAFEYFHQLIQSSLVAYKYGRSSHVHNTIFWVQYGNFFDLVTLFALSLAFNGKILITMHAGMHWCHVKVKPLWFVSQLLLSRATKICLIAEWQKSLFIFKTIKRKIILIKTLLPSWIDAPHASLSKDNSLLFAGRITAEKGIFDLLYAYAKSKKRCRLGRLCIAGDGDKSFIDKCISNATSLGIADDIVWLGMLSEHDLHLQMRKSIVLINPSYADAFSLINLEAIALSLPVIAYDLSGTTDQISTYGGICVPVGNIEKLADAITYISSGNMPVLDTGSIIYTYNWMNIVSEYEHLLNG